MSIAKGFIAIGALADNAPGVVAQFGELSDIATTFSKEKGYYREPSNSTSLVTFKVADTQGDPIALPSNFSSGILDLSDVVYTLYSNDQMIDFEDAQELADYLATQFSAPDYSDISVGSLIVDDSDSNKKMPDYVAWTMTLGGETFNVRIWFSDTAFRAQYDEYELTVIPPLETLDDLNNTPSAVSTALDGVSPATVVSWVEDAKGDHPFTTVRSHPLTWNNPGGGGGTLPTQWTVLIYGPAGDNVDHINAEIINYIGLESQLDLSQWETIYPGLFSTTEFYLVPSWSTIAISEVSPSDGIYSPTVVIDNALSDIIEYAQGYNEQYVTENATTSNSVWKSIQFTSIGNVNNAGGNIRLDQLYPDYIAVPTSSLDFARMAPDTQEFAQFLGEMFELAQEATPSTILPSGYTRVNRGGYLYLAYRLGEVNFLCLTKYTYEA